MFAPWPITLLTRLKTPMFGQKSVHALPETLPEWWRLTFDLSGAILYRTFDIFQTPSPPLRLPPTVEALGEPEWTFGSLHDRCTRSA